VTPRRRDAYSARVKPQIGRTGAGRRKRGGTMGDRPIGVTILAALAGVALLLSIVHLLQAIGIIPYFIGDISIRSFNLWYVLMWGLMVWVWLWVVRALLAVDPSAWLFLLIVSGFNLIFDFFTLIQTPDSLQQDIAASFVINLVIFGYAMLPTTKASFGVE
jgi:hypothetical protein